MKWPRRWRHRNAELMEEIQTHFRMAVADRIARGEAPEDAEAAARREFGNRTQVQETTRSMWRGAGLDAAGRYVRHASRGLLRSPGFTIAATLTLGLGIGGLTAIATVVHAVLLQPLPYPESDRLFSVPIAFMKAGGLETEQSDASFLALQRLNRSAEVLGASLVTEVNLSDDREPERVPAAKVTVGFFQVLKPVPILGRAFVESEDSPGGVPVVVLSEGLWKRRFGAARDVIGRTLSVEGSPHEVIGVMPSWVNLPNEDVQLWMPLRLDPSNTFAASSAYGVIARLRPRVDPKTAQRDFQSALARLPDLYPSAGFGISTRDMMAMADPVMVVRPLRDQVVGDIGSVLWVLFGTGAFVLLVACANVATLFLVRADGRQREMAVRAALGASRVGLLGQFVAEGMVLATAGAALGLALTVAGIRALSRGGTAGIPRLGELAVNGFTIGLVLILTVLVGLGCSILALARIRRRNVAAALRSGGRAATADRQRQRARHSLVVAQVTLAFALLAGSGLLARSFWQLRAVDPGFAGVNSLAFRVALPEATYPRIEDVARQHQQIQDRLAHLPGVRAAGLTSKLPLRPGGESNNSVWVEDRPDLDPARSITALVTVEGRYFEAIGIPVVAGRTFDQVDPNRSSDQAVVSLAFAKRTWGDSTGRAALGRRIRFGGPTWLTIVGVVGDARTVSLAQPPKPTAYLPTTSPWLFPADDAPAEHKRLAAMAAPRALTGVVEVSGDPAAITSAVRAAIRDLDPTIPVFDLMPMSRVLAASLARTTFSAALLGLAAALALFLGVIGIYGVVAYTVSLRTREIGLRLALGARPGQMATMLVRQGMTLVAAGIAGGILLTLFLSRALRALLFGISPSDPLTLSLVAALLIAAALIASWLPAYRARRIDPASVLVGE